MTGTKDSVLDELRRSYQLPTRKDVNLHPMNEFWHNGKPYLYNSGYSHTEECGHRFYDVTTREAITITVDKDRFSFFGFEYEGHYVKIRGQWPQEYVNTLPEYQFNSPDIAGAFGIYNGKTIHLVLKYNDDFGLFRSGNGFISVYLPFLTEILKLNL